MKKKDWDCKECDAQFRWLVNEPDDLTENFKLRVPKTKEDWQDAELFTDAGMFTGEFYYACDINDCCDSCRKKLIELGEIRKRAEAVK